MTPNNAVGVVMVALATVGCLVAGIYLLIGVATDTAAEYGVFLLLLSAVFFTDLVALALRAVKEEK